MDQATRNLKSSNTGKTQWSEHELKMINVVDVFKEKPLIMKKAEGYLDELRKKIIAELEKNPQPYPSGTDLTKGQLTRGENNKGFPYLSLDIPQLFNKEEFFTYRILFWWGHYLGFSLILKGPALSDYTENILKKRNDGSCSDIFLAKAKTPWEWELNETNFQMVSEGTDKETAELIQSLMYIKLCRVFPVDEKRFLSLDWQAAGITSFLDLTKLVMG